MSIFGQGALGIKVAAHRGPLLAAGESWSPALLSAEPRGISHRVIAHYILNASKTRGAPRTIPPAISAQPFCFRPAVVFVTLLRPPRGILARARWAAEHPSNRNYTPRERWPTRKSLERMNLLYLLLCYAIIKTECGAGRKEMMVFTQRSRLVGAAVRGANYVSKIRKRLRCKSNCAGPSSFTSACLYKWVLPKTMSRFTLRVEQLNAPSKNSESAEIHSHPWLLVNMTDGFQMSLKTRSFDFVVLIWWTNTSVAE